VRPRDLVREHDRLWAVRARRRGEDADVDRPVDGGKLVTTGSRQHGFATADQEDRANQRDELVSRGRPQEADVRVALDSGLVLSDQGNRGNAVDSELLRALLVENEVHFLDRDPAGQRRQLVDDLAGLQTGLTPDR